MLRDLTASEAQRLILEATSALGPETVAFPEALSRVLAERVLAGRDLPPADNSAMDGYAVRAADLAGAASDRPVRLRVAFEVAAGTAATRALGAGEAARILTGAPIPPGADSIVRQEDATREGASVLLRVAPRLRENVRERGEDVRSGERVLEPGAVIGPAEVGMLAALGPTETSAAEASSRRTRTRSRRSAARSAPSPATSASRATIPPTSSAASAPACAPTCW